MCGKGRREVACGAAREAAAQGRNLGHGEKESAVFSPALRACRLD